MQLSQLIQTGDPDDVAADGTGEVAQLMGFGAFGDKKAQFRQYKTNLGLKEAINATRRDKKWADASTLPR